MLTLNANVIFRVYNNNIIQNAAYDDVMYVEDRFLPVYQAIYLSALSYFIDN